MGFLCAGTSHRLKDNPAISVHLTDAALAFVANGDAMNLN